MNESLIYQLSMTLINLAEIVIVRYFYDGFFARKKISRLKDTAVYLGIVLLVTVCSLLFTKVDVATMIVLTFYFIILIYGYQGKFHIKVIASIFVLLFTFVMEMLAAIILVTIFGFQLSEARENMVFFISGAIVSKLLLVVLFRTIIKFNRHNVSNISIRSWLLIISIPVASIYIIISSIYQNVMDNQFSPHVAVLCIAILYINLITFHLFDGIINQIEENNQYRIRQNYLLMQQEQYENLISSYDKVKRMRHDMINHMVSLAGYLNNSKYQEAMSYVENLSANLSDATRNIISGNVVIDAIINNKKDMMASKDVVFHTDIVVGNLSRIDDMDLCILLGNALDNAIEACERIRDSGRKKIIDLKIRCVKGNLIINLQNSYEPNSLKIVKGEYISSKWDQKKADCGMGIGNMRNIAKKYHGNLKIEISEEFFQLTLLIPDSVEAAA